MFVKNKAKPAVNEHDLAHHFFRSYIGSCDLYQVIDGEKKLSKSDLNVTFVSEKRDWDFFVVLENKGKGINPYFLKINAECDFGHEFLPNDNIVAFHFKISSETNLIARLEFTIQGGSFEEATRFMNIFTRLLWQIRNKDFYRQAGGTFNFDELCPRLNSEISSSVSPKITQLLEDLMSGNDYDFLGIGEIYSNKEGHDPLLIQGNYIFGIAGTQPFEYEFRIFDENNTQVYAKNIDSNLQYYCNENSNDISWLDNKAGVVASLTFRFKQDRASSNLLIMMQLCILQTNNKMSVDDYVSKGDNKDWLDYYARDEETIEEADDVNPFADYEDYRTGREHINVGFGQSRTFNQMAEDPDYTGLSQAKFVDRTILAKGSVLDFYRANEEDDNGLEYLVSLPPVKSLGGEDINPNKMMLTEQDTKMLLLDQYNPSSVYYMDLNQGKIVSELKHSNGKGIVDISLLSKDAFAGTNPEFLGVQEKGILRLDPRVANSIVEERAYKTDYGFNTITGAVGNFYAVGSDTGDIRLFDKISGAKARNLLPSMFGQKIISLDTSASGEFILACTRSIVMLIPTMQDGKNGFSFTFRKASKPQPKILKVDPKTMAQNGFDSFSFNYAKFDERKGSKETSIIAVSSNCMIIWSLKKIMRGQFITKAVKKFEDKIISHDYKYNSDKFVAALPKKILVQDADFK